MSRAFLRIRTRLFSGIRLPFNGKLGVFSIAACAMGVAPTTSFALPNGMDVVLRPNRLVVYFRPYNVYLYRSVLQDATSGNDGPRLIHILQAIRLLGGRVVTFQCGVRSRSVVLAEIAKRVGPYDLSAKDYCMSRLGHQIHDSNLQVERAGSFQVGQVSVISGIGPPDAFYVTLPVNCMLTVKAPTRTIATERFFLMRPIRYAIRGHVASITNRLCGLSIKGVLRVSVISTSVDRAYAVKQRFNGRRATL